MAQKQNKQIKHNPVLKDFETLIAKVKQEKLDLEKALEDKNKQLDLLIETKNTFEKGE